MALLLGRQYIDLPAYGGKYGFHRFTTTANPDTVTIAPTQYTGQAAVLQAMYNGANVALSQSVGSIVCAGGAPTDATTITIGGQVYRIKNTMAQANDVQADATAGGMKQNLIDAINGNPATAGTAYYTGTVQNSSVFAISVAAGTLAVVSRNANPGVITISESGDTAAVFSEASTSGGNGGSVYVSAANDTDTGDRVALGATLYVVGFPIGTTLTVVTMHGTLAGVNSSAIG